MTMEAPRIRGPDGAFTVRACGTRVLVESGGMMIDHYDNASSVTWLSDRNVPCRFAEKFAETRHLVHFQAMRIRTLEKLPPRSHHKCKPVSSMRLDFT